MNSRFAVLHICPFLKEDGYIIECWTDCACHLWLRGGYTEPAKHLEPVLRRGLEMHCDPRFCFTKAQDWEQHEAGDTLYHSFNVHPIPNWANLYFYLYGDIAGQRSNSTSPIMQYPLDLKGAQAIQSQRGYSDSGIEVSYYRPLAMVFPPQHPTPLSGVELFIYGFHPALKLSIHIYDVDATKRPTGSPLASTYLAKVPYKRIFPDKAFFFIPLPEVLLFPMYFYALVIYGDPDSPSQSVLWWSMWPKPGDYPGQVAFWGQWTGAGWNWIEGLISVLQYRLWVYARGATPCPSLPANITP